MELTVLGRQWDEVQKLLQHCVFLVLPELTLESNHEFDVSQGIMKCPESQPFPLSPLRKSLKKISVTTTNRSIFVNNSYPKSNPTPY